MGFFDAIRLTSTLASIEQEPVKASLSAFNFPTSPAMPWASDADILYVTRLQAMQLPSVARSRNIIAGSIANLPLWAYQPDGRKIMGKDLLRQPDPGCPVFNTISWTVDDLIFYGVSYWQVLAVSLEDGRPVQARRIDPLRVSYTTDPTGTLITGYTVDSTPVPNKGVSSLIMFQASDEGVLRRGGRTIQTGLELEKAANRMAAEPAPMMVIKNSGVDLPAEQVSELMTNWKTARSSRSTAYLTGQLDVNTFGFNSMEMQLVEARQHSATEISRLMGIPAWFLSAENASATYSNVSAEKRTLVDMSLRTYMASIEQRLSMDDITPRGNVVRFDLDNFLRGNAMEHLDVVAKMLELKLINEPEARAMVDLAPRGAE